MSAESPSPDEPATGGPRTFDTTQWSVVARAADPSSPAGRAALEHLCKTYWYPLYWFARSEGLARHDAQDLIQGFFEDLLERGAIAHADANRGRFRTFLIAALKNFHSNQRASAARLKRGGGQQIVSLDTLTVAEARFQHEPADTTSAADAFDQKWATSLIACALDRLKQEYEKTGRAAWFVALRSTLLGDDDGASYAVIASTLDSTEGAVKVAVHRMRQRLREYLREEVGKTVLHPGEIDDELRHLLSVSV